ncbi:MAG: DUF3017 domain-containing protein [Propionibacteriaceae bacterium]|nr:DUF3017 domain-containing protein [Propionibacteriaceae bacterium]
MTREEKPTWSVDQGPRAPRPWYQLVLGQWPLAVVLVGITIGMGWVALSHWKRGTFVIGVAFAVGALLRAVLPTDRIGLLGVRRRWVDVVCLGLLGAGIILLVLIVPPQP